MINFVSKLNNKAGEVLREIFNDQGFVFKDVASKLLNDRTSIAETKKDL
jgi:hypothetical protein